MNKTSYILLLFVGLMSSGSICAAQQKKDAPRLTAQERYEQRLAEVEAYNAYVERYMSRDISHRLGAWGQIGYSSMQTSSFSTFNTSEKGGVGGGVGAGYQMRYKTLLLQTGLEVQFYSSALSLYSTDKKHPLLQTRYPVEIGSPTGLVSAQASYNYANTIDQLVAGYLQIPLLAGMELIDHQMYFLVGPKIGLNILANSTLKSDASIQIEDPELIDPLHDMPTHNLTAQRLKQQQKASFGMNLALSAEIGMSLDKYYQPDPEIKQSRLTDAQKHLQNLHTRIAVFGEYGVLNINSSKSCTGWDIPFSEPQVGDPIDLNAIQMCSSLETTGAVGAHINPWMVGVKVSVWYDLPRKQLREKALPKAPQQPQQQSQPQPQQQPQPVEEPQPEVFTYEEQKITVGMNVKIENLFFATNKTDVLPESKPALDQLYTFLSENPQVEILLVGHTDSIGSIKDNQILSEGRVNSVRNEMVKRGIDVSRIQVEGRGELEPVDTNSTEEGRQNNRRVEFTIIAIKNE